MKKLNRNIHSHIKLLIFNLKKFLFGFDMANTMVPKLDKTSLLLVLKKNGATIGSNCDIETGLVFHNCNNYKNLRIGNNSHIGKNCFIDLRDKISIGNNVTISMKCALITHQDMGKSSLTSLYDKTNGKIIIENNAYIGANSTVLKDVKIGEESIVAACSLVNTNVDKRIIVGGGAAKLIKKIKS